MTTLLGQLIIEEESYEGNAVDFLNHGFSFLQAAKVLYENAEKLGPHKFAPVYNDMVQAYELLFKALLLNSGYTHEELRKQHIRHNLEVLLKASKEHGLKPSADDEYQIIELNKFIQKHEFRYPRMGGKFIQGIDYLLQIGQELHIQICEIMRKKKVANDQN
jgi:hypothetical protein